MEENGNAIEVGRVLRSSTAAFTVGAQQLIADQDALTPRLGALIKTAGARNNIFGLICNVTIEDDAFVRQLVAAGVDNPVMIEDQRQRRQVPVVIEVLAVGHGDETAIYHRLPPQPPRTLDMIYTCNNAELRRFSERHDWLRIVLAAPAGPVDQILVAALRAAAAARPSIDEQEQYLIGAGRELARLLALDLSRLDGILRQLR